MNEIVFILMVLIFFGKEFQTFMAVLIHHSFSNIYNANGFILKQINKTIYIG